MIKLSKVWFETILSTQSTGRHRAEEIKRDMALCTFRFPPWVTDFYLIRLGNA